MGLEVGFYAKGGDEVISLRNHHRFTDLLFEEPGEIIAPYSDFRVTALSVEVLLAKIENEMEEHGLRSAPRPRRCPAPAQELLDDIPDSFCRDEPERWSEALPHYQLLLVGLLALIRRDGALICSWSA